MVTKHRALFFNDGTSSTLRYLTCVGPNLSGSFFTLVFSYGSQHATKVAVDGFPQVLDGPETKSNIGMHYNHILVFDYRITTSRN